MAGPRKIFDANLHRRRRDRAASKYAAHDFLYRLAAERLADRLSDVARAFPLAAALGGGGFREILGGRGGIETLIEIDISRAMLDRAGAAPSGVARLVAGEEFLPFADASLDLAISVLTLHWIDDLPGALAQIHRTLKPDGLFLAAMLGGDTLIELRQALLAAEMETDSGVSPRTSPTVELRDAAELMQRARFALPVVDRETVDVSYADPFALMHELRGMGEANALSDRRKTFSRSATFARAAQIYAERFGLADGRIKATFDLILLTGWRPHPSQQQPLARGAVPKGFHQGPAKA
jgi:SAM-dependent methyltransferase